MTRKVGPREAWQEIEINNFHFTTNEIRIKENLKKLEDLQKQNIILTKDLHNLFEKSNYLFQKKEYFECNHPNCACRTKTFEPIGSYRDNARPKPQVVPPYTWKRTKFEIVIDFVFDVFSNLLDWFNL